jgi:hypothetical protein
MRADRDNAIRYLGTWVAAVIAVWSLLMLIGRENIWVDRVLLAEILSCGALAVVFIFVYTPKWTTRAIGVFSLMFGIVVLMTGAGLLDLGAFGEPFRHQEPPVLPPGVEPPAVVPYWWRSLGRSMLAVAGPALLWGYYHWFFEESEKPVRRTTR